MTPIESVSANRWLPVRRRLLSGAGLALSATAVALLGGRESLAAAASGGETEADLRILRTALAAEREAIAAYQLGADSGLLTADVRKLAIGFQSHHKEHADALAATVRKLGGTVNVRIYPNMGHTIIEDEIVQARQIVEQLSRISTS